MPRAKCKHPDCAKGATFNIEGSAEVKFCKSHKTAEMINIKGKRCDFEGCGVLASFGIKGSKNKFCAAHKNKDMLSISNKVCGKDGCNLLPLFGNAGQAPEFCHSHKGLGMINVKHKRCEYEGCIITSPCFDIKSGKGKFCNNHKTEGMINVKLIKCNFLGCTKRGNFDIKGGIDRFCYTHKLPGMRDISSKLCEKDGCTVRANYGIVGQPARFCVSHKEGSMLSFTKKLCIENGCRSYMSYYNLPGQPGKYCSEHKKEKMINVRIQYCISKDCTSAATYGKPGNKISHCFSHREKGMIKRPNSKCKEKGCNEKALWGTNFVPMFCDNHKTEGHTNIVEKPCVSCNLPYILDSNDKCENCNPAAWHSARLAKQNALMDYLDSRELGGDQTDKTINGAECGLERPDRVYDLIDKIIILECDENQHQDRNCSCEQTRMVNIGQSYGGIPVYFIRWNPDSYKPKISNKRQEILPKRYKLCGDLLDDIKKGVHKLPSALVSVIYLYFDGWSSLLDSNWNVVTEMCG
jgi:hypothetical protein